MSTVSHNPSPEPSALARKPAWTDARDMWASFAIGVIWLVVFLTAVFGPNFESHDAGGSSTTIPSAIAVAFFALFATISVAKHGLEKKARDG
jgi:hypothetical protein